MNNKHDIKSKVIAAYFEGVKTVNEICDEFGIARRTVYKWLQESGLKRNRRISVRNRQPFYVSKAEATLLCRILEENEALVSQTEMDLVMGLHDRLVHALQMFMLEEEGIQ